MSLDTFLENLRSKPHHVRKHYAFWTSFGVTAVIAMFWIASFTGINIVPDQAVSAAVAEAGTPAQSLVAGVGAFAGDLWSMITGPKVVHYAQIEVLPGRK